MDYQRPKTSFRKIQACVKVLAESAGPDTLGVLAEMKSLVQDVSAGAVIHEALKRAAERLDLHTDELDEIAVPTYGLQPDGKFSVEFEEYLAELEVQDGKRVVLRWFGRERGRTLTSVPRRIKDGYSELLHELHLKRKAMGKMLTTQRHRIEQFLLTGREIMYSDLLRLYVRQPLIGTLTKNLVWYFETTDGAASGVWTGEQVVGWDNEPIPGISSDSRVCLWHPLLSDLQTVLSWRCWLEDHAIVQPFKQAYREVYLLTPAEQETENYSNRFAAQILLQYQFRALCRSRGWHYSAVDSGLIATKDMPKFGIRAELGVRLPDAAVGNEHFRYIITDQVRFYGPTGPLRLDDISPITFSEIMRDVDTFVAVANIGSDPDWYIYQAGQTPYWQQYAFGDLSQGAENRRAVLKRVLPMLKIANRCEVDGKFLAVKGDLHDYKIHLGSTNVLMEPGSRFLCIQPNENKPALPRTIFLPFEGDRGLAVLQAQIGTGRLCG